MKTNPRAETENALDDLDLLDEPAPTPPADGCNPDPSAIRLKRILVPTDFSDCAQAALDFAVPLARQFGATLIILYVFPPYYEGTPDSVVVNSTEQLLDQLACVSVPLDIFSKNLLRTGQPAEQIVRVAEEFKTDLIVISTHGYTGLKHAWFGSTAESVVRHAPCPVLTVRGKEGPHP